MKSSKLKLSTQILTVIQSLNNLYKHSNYLAMRFSSESVLSLHASWRFSSPIKLENNNHLPRRDQILLPGTYATFCKLWFLSIFQIKSHSTVILLSRKNKLHVYKYLFIHKQKIKFTVFLGILPGKRLSTAQARRQK